MKQQNNNTQIEKQLDEAYSTSSNNVNIDIEMSEEIKLAALEKYAHDKFDPASLELFKTKLIETNDIQQAIIDACLNTIVIEILQETIDNKDALDNKHE